MPQQPLAQVPTDATWYWSDHGSCRERAAKIICMQCPVRVECADYAVRTREPYGVWGGLAEADRERIYSRLDVRQYPRQRGEGAWATAAEIAEAISPKALGLVR